MSTTIRGNILSGYGIRIRALQENDLTENKVDLSSIPGPHVELSNCIAVTGEDLAVALAAIVDVAHSRVVWGSVPEKGDYADPHKVQFVPLEGEAGEAVAQGVINLVRYLLPEVGL